MMMSQIRLLRDQALVGRKKNISNSLMYQGYCYGLRENIALLVYICFLRTCL